MGILIPFALIGAHHVHSYAKRVKLHPASSLLQGVELSPGASETLSREYPALTASHLLITASFFLALGTAVWGIATQRSEERRVGKECRSETAPYQYRGKKGESNE